MTLLAADILDDTRADFAEHRRLIGELRELIDSLAGTLNESRTVLDASHAQLLRTASSIGQSLALLHQPTRQAHWPADNK